MRHIPKQTHAAVGVRPHRSAPCATPCATHRGDQEVAIGTVSVLCSKCHPIRLGHTQGNRQKQRTRQ